MNFYRVLISCGDDEEIVTDDVLVKGQFVEVTKAGALVFYSRDASDAQIGLVIFAPGRWLEVHQEHQ